MLKISQIKTAPMYIGVKCSLLRKEYLMSAGQWEKAADRVLKQKESAQNLIKLLLLEYGVTENMCKFNARNAEMIRTAATDLLDHAGLLAHKIAAACLSGLGTDD